MPSFFWQDYHKIAVGVSAALVTFVTIGKLERIKFMKATISDLFQKLPKIQLPDKFLIDRAKIGDKDAYGELYKRYLEPIYRYIYFRTGQEETVAEDLAETVFFKAWQNINSYNGSSSFKTWLYTITHNAIIDFYRNRKPSLSLAEEIAADDDSLEEKVDRDLVLEKVKKAINKLGDNQKQMITLKFIDDLSNEEIGRMLGKSQTAIRALQSRAIKQLRAIIEDEKE